MILKPAVLALGRGSFAEQRVVRLLRVFAGRPTGRATVDAKLAKLGFAPAPVRRFEHLVKLSLTLG